MSLQNKKLRYDADRIVLGPNDETIKLSTLRPGCTKSPRPLPLTTVNSGATTPTGSRCYLMNDDVMRHDSIVTYVEANKDERKKDIEVRDFII